MIFKRILITFVLLLFAGSAFCSVDSLYYPVFGKIKIYKPAGKPESVILFVSGDGGWNKGVVSMAEMFAGEMNALVVGINIRTYFKYLNRSKAACLYPASDFEELSKFIQHKYQFSKYINPVLIGYSSGATLVYGALAQAPGNTFKGAIGLGFCSDLDVNKLMCKGSGLQSEILKPGVSIDLKPSKNLENPFIALQGEIDQVCGYQQVVSFVNQASNAEVVLLPKVGHGFSVPKNWMPQLKDAFKRINIHFEKKIATASPKLDSSALVKPPELMELPLHITVSPQDTAMPLAFMISGDGGWTGFDQQIADELVLRKIPAIGLDALQYFWSQKLPEKIAADISPVIQYYLNLWGRKKFILVGYSFGADVSPFIVAKLNSKVLPKLKAVVLLSPSESTDFEIHIADMLDIGDSDEEYNVVDAIKKILGIKTLCVFGKDEETSIPQLVKNQNVYFLTLTGGHHFSDLDNMVNELLGLLR